MYFALERNVVFMASWMVHLRIADLLMREFNNVEKTEFVVGNIAPDSGIPGEAGRNQTYTIEIICAKILYTGKKAEVFKKRRVFLFGVFDAFDDGYALGGKDCSPL